jgi:hypothetical protein
VSADELAAAVAELGALPMPVPVGPEPLSAERLAVLRKLRTHCEADRFESEDERPLHVWGPSQYPKREMCQRCTVTREWAEDPEATDVVLLAEVDRLRSQVASLNEALTAAAVRMRADAARIAELEAERPRVRTEAIADVGGFLEEVGEKGAAYLVRTVDILAARDPEPDAVTTVFVPVASLREPDGEFYGLVHHDWRIGRDLPETGGV